MKKKRLVAVLLGVLLSVLVAPFVSGCFKRRACACKYSIVAEYGADNSCVTGTEKVEWTNETDTAVSTLEFNLYANAYRRDAAYSPVSLNATADAYYAGKSYGNVEILSVGGAKSWLIGGEDCNLLLVELEEPVYPDENVTVDISFIVALAKINHRTGVTETGVNLGNVFPVLCAWKDGTFYSSVYYSEGDPFVTDCADYEVKFTAPSTYTVASSGKTVSERALETKREYTFSLQNARAFALVLSEFFKTEETTYQGITIRYLYCDDSAPLAHLTLAKEAIAYFSDSYGKYPYPTYSVVQTGFCYGGMEYPALVMLSDNLPEKEYAYALVHETAHQWWYAVVGNDQIKNAWQDEGLAEYSTALFFDANDSYGFTLKNLVDSALSEYRSYYDVYSRVFGKADTRMNKCLGDFVSSYEYRAIAYDKGMILFDTLRTAIGKDKFAKGLKEYYSSCAYKNASPADLIGAFERTGVDVGGYFSSFIDGKTVV